MTWLAENGPFLLLGAVIIVVLMWILATWMATLNLGPHDEIERSSDDIRRTPKHWWRDGEGR